MTTNTLSDRQPTGPLIRLENVELSLGGRLNPFSQQTTPILDDVCLTVMRGEIVGVVGESGSGKTTLGKAMLRLYRPNGRILYENRDITTLSNRELRPLRRDLQMVFQDPLSSFNPRFKIGGSIGLPMLLHGFARDKKGALNRAGELLQSVGLSADLCDRFPHQLSGGQLQRVAIARALGVQPKLIVADEAVSKLDVSVRAQVLNLIRQTNRKAKIAFVFITHDLGVARYLSDRIAVMFGGRIVEVGETEEVFNRPQHPYTASLINARKQSSFVAESDDLKVGMGAKTACNFASRCPNRQQRCLEVRPSLESGVNNHSVACFYPTNLAASIITGGQSYRRDV